jgi:hypothetical protein
MKNLTLLTAVIALFLLTSCDSGPKWESMFNGKDLSGTTIRGKAEWKVADGVLIGEGGMGHIYLGPELADLEAKGKFRLTDQGGGSNSGFYFRAVEPPNDPDGWPHGYEAQICHNQKAHTGWLWLPGNPTGEATALLSKDGEWFDYRIKAVGNLIQFWVNEQLVMTYEGDRFSKGRFAIQGHNPGMMIEAKDLYYRDLSK